MARDFTKVKFTPEELRECYIDKQMTQREIARYFHTDVQKVRWALHEWNIPVRTGHAPLEALREYGQRYKGKRRGPRSTVLPYQKEPYGAGESINYLDWHYDNYKRNAFVRKHTFELSKERFEEIVTQPCFYCGISSSRKIGDRYFNGIDRTNNDLGYVEGNIRPCCNMCNMAKGRYTEEKFISWLLRTADHYRATHSMTETEEINQTTSGK